MNHGVDARERLAQRCRVGDVALRELDAPRGEPSGASRIADERTHRELTRAEGVHDVRPDEPGAAGDENGHSKFLK